MSDKYDTAIEHLTKNPQLIDFYWCNPWIKPSGCLFDYCKNEDFQESCGCLTQVKHDGKKAEITELTQAIRADDRIPERSQITLEHLPIFAEWQRRMDKELNRV